MYYIKLATGIYRQATLLEAVMDSSARVTPSGFPTETVAPKSTTFDNHSPGKPGFPGRKGKSKRAPAHHKHGNGMWAAYLSGMAQKGPSRKQTKTD